MKHGGCRISTRRESTRTDIRFTTAQQKKERYRLLKRVHERLPTRRNAILQQADEMKAQARDTRRKFLLTPIKLQKVR
jgi:hypothetical protein